MNMTVGNTSNNSKASNTESESNTGVSGTRNSFWQLLIPCVTIFAALCYWLGRLRVESYYYYLGITPSVLVFSPQDYMFSSFNIVLMCLETSVWIFIYWSWARKDLGLLMGLHFSKKDIKKDIAEIVVFISMSISLVMLFSWGVYSLFFNENYTGSAGVLGFQTGFTVGIALIIFTWLAGYIAGSKKLTFFSLALVAIIFLSYLPTVTNAIGRIEARTDIKKFPQTIIISKNDLPLDIQSSPQNSTQSIKLKMVLSNNGMTYLLQVESDSKNQSQIYAIHNEDIKEIIYTH